jgi:glycosyltransferase involved in cell wall biosynthesis
VLRRAAHRAHELWRGRRRWWRILRASRAAPGAPRVYYGYERIPSPGELAHGGIVKFQRLQELYPNTGDGSFNVLYLGSSSMPPDSRELAWLARRRGAKVVWNQNGVAYPGWHGRGWQRLNARMARPLHAADHVFYQSEFCKLSADHFLGERRGPWEILYNAVDTERFTPASARPARPLTLLLGGSQYQRYRLETALRALAAVRRRRSDARLIVTGELTFAADRAQARRDTERLAAELGITGAVELTGAYTQDEAPDVLRRADLLLHTKYNDPCPGIVLEAMACGLPVVYSASGGVTELVGDEAGIGVPAELCWERDRPPDPEALADAVSAVAGELEAYAVAARRRAEEHFDLRPWLERHRRVFEALTGP